MKTDVKRFGNEVKLADQERINLEKNRPFKVKGKNNSKTIDQSNKKSDSFRDKVSLMFSKLGLKELEVMISMNGLFDNQNCFSKLMQVDEFLNYEGDFVLYVAQYSIFNRLTIDDFYNVKDPVKLREKIRKDNFARLQLVFNNFKVPPIVSDRIRDIRKINLWINLEKSKSKLHFDLYDNLLTVMHGRKIVYLFPPDCPAVICKSKNLNLIHEAKIKPEYLPKRKNLSSLRKHFVKSCTKFKKLWKVGMKKCILEAGDSLRIPEGWFHYVISDKETIAFNFWFKSILEDIEKKKAPILRYLIEQDINKKMIKNSNELAKNIKIMSAPLHKFRLALIKDLIKGKLRFEDLLADHSLMSDNRRKLIAILDKLNTIDEKINADLYLNLKRNGLLQLCLTDPYKERFYEIFFDYFNEELRQKALENQAEVRGFLGKRSIDEFLHEL